MKNWCVALIIVALLATGSAGCLSTVSGPAPQQTLQPIPQKTQDSTSATIPAGDMALQLSDVPPDYLLRDRTVSAYEEVSQLARDLGWRQGYRVTFYRMNREKDDLTGIRQSISVYPEENMDKVYAIETEAMVSLKNGTTRYEIPFPATGDRSIAFRENRAGDPYDLILYTVVFQKKNVFETITMGGTTTDYETLKDVVRKAAEKIR